MPVPTDPPPPEAFLVVIGIALYVIAALVYFLPYHQAKPNCAECAKWRKGEPKPPQENE